MNVEQAYNQWADQYDTNDNRTRDLESKVLRDTLARLSVDSCLEIGCGTGKNTVFFAEKCKEVLSVDLSEGMLAKAKEKITSNNVIFQQADITGEWNFVSKKYDLVSFSLVLEHIEQLDHIFKQCADALSAGGHIYIGELHPFKQYAGSKARFNTDEGEQVVTCFNHHISDFILPAEKYGFSIKSIGEYFDDDNRNNIPRILAILFEKK